MEGTRYVGVGRVDVVIVLKLWAPFALAPRALKSRAFAKDGNENTRFGFLTARTEDGSSLKTSTKVVVVGLVCIATMFGVYPSR